MLQETMKTVKDAEAEADAIVSDAGREADAIAAASKKEAADIVSAAVAKARDDMKAAEESQREDEKKLSQKALGEAAAEGARLRETAAARQDEVTEALINYIVEN